LFESYLALHRALANDDHVAAVKAAGQALTVVDKVDMHAAQGEDHAAWMKAAGALKKTFGDLSRSKTIEEARGSFALCSEQMTSLANRFGAPGGRALYEIRCPMAFRNRGAIWLQEDAKVRNPYFGQVMLACGEVTHVIRVAGGAPAAGNADKHAPAALPGGHAP
jgi:Cu(I)/Ag(I) efflux system membrane fusion protein